MQISQDKPGFVLLGDTQRTMGYQILMGKEANNHAERLKLIEHLKERNPEFLLMLGDLVCYGHSPSDWAYFDQLMAPVSCPILAALGNHDYFFFQQEALNLFHQRFPFLKEKTWYTKRWGELTIVVLNSNKGPLKQEWNEQLQWLKEELSQLENDPSVKGIIFCAHHPPFTNSLEIGPHRPSIEDFLPLFLASNKTLAYFSGHCHAYERFEVQGKAFIVSGGGGGPRQSLRLGPLVRIKDRFAGGRLRPFHYLWISLSRQGLQLEVWGLEKGAPSLQELERLLLPWNV